MQGVPVVCSLLEAALEPLIGRIRGQDARFVAAEETLVVVRCGELLVSDWSVSTRYDGDDGLVEAQVIIVESIKLVLLLRVGNLNSLTK